MPTVAIPPCRQHGRCRRCEASRNAQATAGSRADRSWPEAGRGAARKCRRMRGRGSGHRAATGPALAQAGAESGWRSELIDPAVPSALPRVADGHRRSRSWRHAVRPTVSRACPDARDHRRDSASRADRHPDRRARQIHPPGSPASSRRPRTRRAAAQIRAMSTSSSKVSPTSRATRGRTP